MGSLKESGYKILISILFIAPLGLIAFKAIMLNYSLADLVPAVRYHVALDIEVTGYGEEVRVQTYLPKADSRQEIEDERHRSGLFSLSFASNSENRIATWEADHIVGRHRLNYTFSTQPSRIRYHIPENLPIPVSHPKELQAYLQPTEGIQVGHPLIRQTLAEIVPETRPTTLEALTAIHHYLQHQLANKNFSGYTDAVTALKLGEASCNGKSRLFAALARQLKLPARLAGGLILTRGTKRVTHQWVEINVNGYWVPFDTINDHFAEIPANYLTLYYGDLVLFKFTDDVNFQYSYETVKQLMPRKETRRIIQASALGSLNLYPFFEEIGISQELLQITIMLPYGALVTAVLRNVVGLQCFGTFLPALIAIAAHEMGLWWGAFAFSAIILITALCGRLLDALQLLHTPKMAILLTIVIIIMMTLTIVGIRSGITELAHISLFPIAILTITAERFAMIQTEQGFRNAAKILFTTICAVAICYIVMNSTFLQSMTMIFPELLLVLMALNLWLGRWVGMRLLEYVRFRGLIGEREQ